MEDLYNELDEGIRTIVDMRYWDKDDCYEWEDISVRLYISRHKVPKTLQLVIHQNNIQIIALKEGFGDGKEVDMEKKQLKAIVMEHREPLADMYFEHCEELFEVFNDVAIVTDEEIVPIAPIWLAQVDLLPPVTD